MSSDTESGTTSDSKDGSAPHPPLVFVALREEWRRCWCLALRHPRELLRTSGGRVLLLRGFGLVVLLSAIVVVLALRAVGHITPTIACRGVGTCLGVMPGVLRIPGSSSGAPSRRWKQIVLAAALVVVSAALLIAPWPNSWVQEYYQVFWFSHMAAIALLTPLALVVVASRHPPSPYFRDAIWCIVSFWLVIALSLWKASVAAQGPSLTQDLLSASALHFEGIVFAWMAWLMATRIQALESLGADISFIPKHSTSAALIMSAAVLKSSCEMLIYLAGWEWDSSYVFFAAIFLSIWSLYSTILATLLVRGVLLLRAEVRHTRAAAKVEAKWAAKVLCIELAASLALIVTTAAKWAIWMSLYLLWLNNLPLFPLSDCGIAAHGVDPAINAISIAVLSGLIWQPAMSKMDRDRSASSATFSLVSGSFELSPGSSRAGSASQAVWRGKVSELAHRGTRLCDLLSFWQMLLAKKVMPGFDPARSTTNDVVRQVVIPMSRDAVPDGGGRAMASIWNERRGGSRDGLLAQVMVTHNWSNLFWHLVAAIVSDQLGLATYASVAEDLLMMPRVRKLRRELARRGALDTTYWVCAFAINQHSGICGGFGPEPNEMDTQRQAEKLLEYDVKRRDTVTGEVFRVCDCRQPKMFNSQPGECEMNKFDDMMNLLAKLHEGHFSHLIVVDAEFEVFRRAWCVAEIVESDRSGIPQRMMIHSQQSLDAHYSSLLRLDVRDCDASRAEDREMILQRIGEGNHEAFNTRLVWAVFGTEGLLSQWYDGRQRAALVGRILQRAKRAAEGRAKRRGRRACAWSVCCRAGPVAERIGSEDSDESTDKEAA